MIITLFVCLSGVNRHFKPFSSVPYSFVCIRADLHSGGHLVSSSRYTYEIQLTEFKLKIREGWRVTSNGEFREALGGRLPEEEIARRRSRGWKQRRYVVLDEYKSLSTRLYIDLDLQHSIRVCETFPGISIVPVFLSVLPHPISI